MATAFWGLEKEGQKVQTRLIRLVREAEGEGKASVWPQKSEPIGAGTGENTKLGNSYVTVSLIIPYISFMNNASMLTLQSA